MSDDGEKGGGGMNVKGVDGSQQLVKCFDHPWGMFSKLKWVSVVQQCVVTWMPIFVKSIRPVTAQEQVDQTKKDGYCCGNSSFVLPSQQNLDAKKKWGDNRQTDTCPVRVSQLCRNVGCVRVDLLIIPFGGKDQHA